MSSSHNYNPRKVATVLIVDDNRADREVIKRTLKDGKIICDIFEVENGEQALKFLNNESPYNDKTKAPRPDVVLLDINMPRVDGLTVLKTFRHEMNVKNIPFIILSTSDRIEDVVKSYDLGVAAYITKPVDTGEFIRAIQKLQSFWFELVTFPPKSD